MRADEYPAQEPVSAAAAGYVDECVARSFGVPFYEFRYGDDPYQSVAIYPAEQPNGIVLVFAHGGGWTGGYKEWMGFMAPAMVAKGVTFVSIGYRLAPAHVFPAGVADMASAIAAIYERGGEFAGGAPRLFIGGHSAGGHYAALLAVRRDWQAAHGLPLDVVSGCLPISGVYNFGADAGLAVRPRFLGPEDSAQERPASPILNIEGTPPPFLMAHGSEDFPHLIEQAEQMEVALQAAGGDVVRLVLSGCDHFTASLAAGDVDGPWAPAALAWMTARSL